MRITHVREQPSGWWVVRDSSGGQHATKDSTMVKHAQRLRDREADVSILSFQGFYYRELRNITEVTQKEQAS